MSLLEDIFEFINSVSLWDRSGWHYLSSILLFVGLMVIFYIIRYIGVKRLENYLERKEEVTKGQVVVTGMKKVLNFKILFILSLFISIQALDPNRVIMDGLRFVLLLIFSYFLIQFSFVIVDYLIEFQSQRSTDSTNILEFFRLVLKATLFVIIALWALANFGVNTDVFIASIGVLSLAIAFALQNVISDVFAALTIYLDRPIEIGDTIVISGEMGTVEKIGIRSTRLRTLDGHMLIVSNREIINSRISNYQKMERRRVPFTIGVHCNTSPSVLKEIPGIIEEIINSVDNTNFDRAFLNSLSKFTYDFDVVYFVQSRSYTKYLETHEQVTMKIIEVFKEHNIEIPYPTQTLHVERSNSQEVN